MHATGAGVLHACSTAAPHASTSCAASAIPPSPAWSRRSPSRVTSPASWRPSSTPSADIGLATDGDADRLGVVDEKGHFVDQHQTFALLCYYLLEYRGMRGPIVRSLTSTRMIDRLGELYGVPVLRDAGRLQVPRPQDDGDQAPWRQAKRAAVTPSRSTCPSATAASPACSAGPPGALRQDAVSSWSQELYAKVGEHFYDRIDVHLQPKPARERHRPRRRCQARRASPGASVLRKDSMDGYRFEFEGGWLLIRPSGTEPLLRIYTEMTDQALVRPVLEAGRELAGV